MYILKVISHSKYVKKITLAFLFFTFFSSFRPLNRRRNVEWNLQFRLHCLKQNNWTGRMKYLCDVLHEMMSIEPNLWNNMQMKWNISCDNKGTI